MCTLLDSKNIHHDVDPTEFKSIYRLNDHAVWGFLYTLTRKFCFDAKVWHNDVFLCRLRMNRIFTLLVLVQLSICHDATLDGRQFNGIVSTVPTTDDAHLTRHKSPLDVLPIDPVFMKICLQKRTANGRTAIVQRLVSEAKRVYSRGRISSNFEINGDLERAFNDFYSFKPVIMKSHEGGGLHTGWAGDRYLSLRTNSPKGDPILAVTDWKKKGQGRYIQRFIYKKSDDD